MSKNTVIFFIFPICYHNLFPIFFFFFFFFSSFFFYMYATLCFVIELMKSMITVLTMLTTLFQKSFPNSSYSPGSIARVITSML
ncbi:hypothetical protein C1646_720772 [Rhizophagus diaphanus]|nr:hypothetical protein C1646_720772 [Rhizophagus diaphanus] [Rhizophagus sp. MUCL 43196]